MEPRILGFCGSIVVHALALALAALCLGNWLDARVPGGAPVVAVTFLSVDNLPNDPAQDLATTFPASKPLAVPTKPFETPIMVEPVVPEQVKPEPIALAQGPVVVPARPIPSQPQDRLGTATAGSPADDLQKLRRDEEPDPVATSRTSTGIGLPAHPAYRKNPEPAYPEMARRRGEQGTVVLAVRVTAAGRALHVQVKKSSGFILLDEAAARAVRGWEFEPARLNTLQVDSDIEVPVQFKLNDRSA